VNKDELINAVEDWAVNKGLTNKASSHAQLCKLLEESGELAAGVLKQNEALIEDSLGDVLVVLIILSKQLGKDLFECLELAYGEIKDRKGKMVDGSFVKEVDL